MTREHNHFPRSFANGMCTECGVGFTFDPAEFETFPTMNWTRYETHGGAPHVLRTWIDWIEHCSSRCALCRYCEPPDACLRDYRRHQARADRG